jgi:hypothetical protein
MGGEFSTIAILYYWLFYGPVQIDLRMNEWVVKAICWLVAAVCGLATSLTVYCFVRTRLMRNSDYDELRSQHPSHIAHIGQSRDGDDVLPK